LATLGASAVEAQPQKRDPVAAETLYQSARELRASGNHEAACAKFEASMALNPRATTLLNLASCSERQGKLTEALARYQRAQALLNEEPMDPDRRRALGDLAKRGRAEVEPRIARLRVDVEAAPAGLEVKRDGVKMLPAMIGEELPIDPGSHTLEASAPGHEDVRRKVTLAEGQSLAVELALAPEKRSVAAPAGPAPDDDAGGGIGAVPIWAWVVGAAGLVLVGGGVAFKVDSDAAERTLDEQCGEARVCDPALGYDPTDDNARKDRSFGLFVGFTVAGSAAIVASVVGIVTGLTSDGASGSSARLMVYPVWEPGTAAANLAVRF
jgi:hypothetical protein